MTARIAVACMAIALPTVLSAQAKPSLAPADYGKWESIGATSLSPDGRWLAYGVSRVNEEGELRLRAVRQDSTLVLPYATGAMFSPDSRVIAYTIGVSPAAREKLEREKKPVRSSLAIRTLATGRVDTVADVASFRFSPDGRFVMMRRYPAEGRRTADVMVHSLDSGTRITFGSVSDAVWAPRRSLLSLTVETDGGEGNAIQVYDAATGVVRVLDSSPSIYRQMTWRPESDDLAVLRTHADKAFRDTTHSVLLWSSVGAGGRLRTLDATGSAVPSGMRISEGRRPRWSDDGRTVFIGLRARTPATSVAKPAVPPSVGAAADSARTDTASAAKPAEPKAPDVKPSDVQVWHSTDLQIMRAQELQDAQERQRTLLAAWNPVAGNVTTITSSLQSSSDLVAGGRYAYEMDASAYERGVMFGRPYSDVWMIDASTGRRTKAIEKVRHFYHFDTADRRVAWYDGTDFWSYDPATAAKLNLTADVDTDFGDLEWDYPGDMRPPAGAAGWTKDGRSLLVHDHYDVWSIAADGSGARRLTDGAADRIRYRVMRIGGPDEGFDLSKPLYLSVSGDGTAKSGYARLIGNRVENLVFLDERVARLSRADSADVFVYSRERFDDAPDLFVGGPQLSTATQVTRINPFQAEYGWGRAEIVKFTSDGGKPLAAGLYYPANYDSSKKYPMIVYTYELLSENIHSYVVPSERSYYNKAAWTANGYFVLEPDIVFRAREPGISTLESVVPAVRAVVARGLADSARVGHIGHSWGGYEAAFLPTRTRIFAAGVAGAAITNMLSFNGAVHWSGGLPEYGHWETGQARMEVPPWEDMDAYIRNSPIARIQDLKSPLLVMTGDADGTVDWKQSLEFYNAARRAGVPDLVMLVYPGEDHGLRKKENQVDYHRRINEWFGHYLKGEPAPAWLDGMTWQERKAALEAAR